MIGEPVDVIRPTTSVDRYNNTVTEYSDTASFTVEGCAFDPGGSIEIAEGRTAVVTRPTLFAPPGTRFEPTDRLLVRGALFEVSGDPAVWVNPYSASEKGVVVPLIRVAG